METQPTSQPTCNRYMSHGRQGADRSALEHPDQLLDLQSFPASLVFQSFQKRLNTVADSKLYWTISYRPHKCYIHIEFNVKCRCILRHVWNMHLCNIVIQYTFNEFI